jgi:hypothetical protein
MQRCHDWRGASRSWKRPWPSATSGGVEKPTTRRRWKSPPLIVEAEAVAFVGDLDPELALPADLLFLDTDRLLHLEDMGEVGVEQQPDGERGLDIAVIGDVQVFVHAVPDEPLANDAEHARQHAGERRIRQDVGRGIIVSRA